MRNFVCRLLETINCLGWMGICHMPLVYDLFSKGQINFAGLLLAAFENLYEAKILHYAIDKIGMPDLK